MLNKLPLTAISLFIFIFIFPLHANTVFAQRIPPEVRKILENLPPGTLQKMIEESQPKGEMSFTALPPQQFFKPPVGISAPFQPTEAWFQGGSAWAYELDKCRVEDKETIYIKNAYVFYLDEERLDSTFTTNQKARTANIKLKGHVDRWQGRCNSGEFRKVGSSNGGLEFSFTNTFHLKPRFFQSNSASGKMSGAGLDEVVKGISQKGEPVAFSYAKSENKSSYDPKLLEALRKAGYPIPDVNPEEYEKAAQESLKTAGFSLDMDKPVFYGRLVSPRMIRFEGGEVPAVQVDFGISSGFEADMLVYRPEGLVSENSPSSKGNTIDANPLLDNAFILNANYISDFSNFFANKKSNNSQQQTAGNVYLIPDGLQNSVGAQAFVNLDNDDKNGKFDLDDTNMRSKDDDLVRIVLRIPKREPRQRAGIGYLKVKEGKKFVEVWEDPRKEKKFNYRALNESGAKEFVDGTGEFVNFRIKELWVEGIEAQQKNSKQTIIEFTYFNGPADKGKLETFAMTVIGLETIEWEGKANSKNNDNILDKDTNHKNPKDAVFNPCAAKTSVTSNLKPEAVRVFPGWRMINGALDKTNKRDVVTAKVTLSVAPVEPVSIYFESFDVDDPSAAGLNKPQEVYDNDAKMMVATNPQDEGWTDKETGVEEDNRGSVGAFRSESKSGVFLKEGPSGILRETFSQQTQSIEFRVSMQPGDNFRIVGSPDIDFLKNLKNDDEKLNVGSNDEEKNANKQRIVDDSVLMANRTTPEKAEVREADKYASKVLTVWRFFYSEVDYMGAIKPYKIQGNIKSLEPNTPVNGMTKINLYENITAKLKEFTNVSTNKGTNGVENSFQEGSISIRNKEYLVYYNSANATESDHVIVHGSVDGVPESRYFLQDDDESWGFKEGINLEDVVIPNRNPVDVGDACYVEARFQHAYILPDFKTLKANNPERTTDYVRNLKAVNDIYRVEDLNKIYKFNNRDTHASEYFWTIYILFGHKGATYEDGDPDGGSASISIPKTNREGALEGITDAEKIGIVIFLEGIIERLGGVHTDFNARSGEQDCIAHEIGHIFGASHQEQGLMGEGATQNSAWFSKKTLNTIRSAKHP